MIDLNSDARPGVEIRGDSIRGAERKARFQQAWRWRSRNRRPCADNFATAHTIGLTSIIIPTHNQRDYTEMCVQSVRWCTDDPYELIVVDNGSTDGTPDWLATQPDIRLIRNSENLGFAPACNQGLRAATGSRLLLLNNDVVVTPYWLTRLIRALERDPRVGMVGPRSNFVSGPQCLASDYVTLAELEARSQQLAEQQPAVTEETERLVGFCLLMRRSVVETIGLLDEQFAVGNFEDDDYCRRAIAAGFRLQIACDTFVHHFGNATFRGLGWDAAVRSYETNRQRFLRKWAAGGDFVNAREQTPATPSQPLAPAGQRISLVMICRDNEGTIAAALESVRPWVDEMIVVDTGSSDRTVQIARDLGASVHFFPWCDDFSAARNASLDRAGGDWVFWMDSDDTIAADQGQRLRRLASSEAPPEVLAYVVQVHCPGSDGANDLTVVDHVKLFRNRADLRFEGRIHEQILPAIRRAGGEVRWTDIQVVHSGYDHSPDGQRRKRDRDLRILHQEFSEQPNHPFTLFNLGMTYADLGEPARAADYLRQSIRLADPTASHLRKAYALLIYCLRREERIDEAWNACELACQNFPNDPELLFRRALLQQDRGDLPGAAETYRSVLRAPRAQQFGSVDVGIYSFKTRQNLAVVYEQQGQNTDAELQWRQVVEEAPTYRLGWRGWFEALLRDGRHGEAEAVANDLIGRGGLRAEGWLCRSRLAESAGDYEQAIRWLHSASPVSDIDALRRICRLTFEHGDLGEATHWLGELCRQAPDDASALHNLGTAHLRQAAMASAVDCFQRSLELRPGSADTLAHLGYALEASGRLAEAEACWRLALEAAPTHEGAHAALSRRAAAG